MDDGGIIGTPALLQQVWDILRVKGPSIGLILNPSKCEWTWIDGTNQPCPIKSGRGPSGMPVVLPEDVCMLGVPMGPVSSASTFVTKKLLGGRMQVLSRLCDFEDAQAAFFLLRTSFSIVRATHFMRTTPLETWPEEAAAFDAKVREAASAILGCTMNDQVFDQASLTPKLGGMGLRKVSEHANVAYLASRAEAASTCSETWSPPACETLPQKAASFELDKIKLARLISEAPNKREKQRLNRLTCEHAGAWISAVPSSVDGWDTVMGSRQFTVAARVRLGVVVAMGGGLCAICKQTFDCMGDHA
jgi:hypothetical protein